MLVTGIVLVVTVTENRGVQVLMPRMVCSRDYTMELVVVAVVSEQNVQLHVLVMNVWCCS